MPQDSRTSEIALHNTFNQLCLPPPRDELTISSLEALPPFQPVQTTGWREVRADQNFSHRDVHHRHIKPSNVQSDAYVAQKSKVERKQSKPKRPTK